MAFDGLTVLVEGPAADVVEAVGTVVVGAAAVSTVGVAAVTTVGSVSVDAAGFDAKMLATLAPAAWLMRKTTFEARKRHVWRARCVE